MGQPFLILARPSPLTKRGREIHLDVVGRGIAGVVHLQIEMPSTSGSDREWQLHGCAHQPFQVAVEEQQVDVKIVGPNTDAFLPRHEGKAHAQLQ